MAKDAKEKTPQTDVRIVGGQTTVKLRSYGDTTMARMTDLLAELRMNTTTHGKVHQAALGVIDAMVVLSVALGFQGLPRVEVIEPAPLPAKQPAT